MKSEEIDRAADTMPLAEADAARLRRDPLLHDLPAVQPPDAAGHLSLHALRSLAAERRRLGDSWVFPEHVSACPLCLDAFQCLLETVPDPGAPALRRFERLWKEAGAAPAAPERGAAPFHRFPLWFLRAAAGLAILLGAATAVHVATRAASPAPAPLETSQITQLALADGSHLTIDPHSRLTVNRSLTGSTRVRLDQGQIEASVVHQTLGRRFTVTTPLGEVRVIGTRFRVAVDSENVTIYENTGRESSTRQYPAKVGSVRVSVIEGVVSVKNPHDQATVAAGRSAVIREGQPLIEVTDTVPREG